MVRDLLLYALLQHARDGDGALVLELVHEEVLGISDKFKPFPLHPVISELGICSLVFEQITRFL